MASSTRSFTAALTRALPLITPETVAMETPARRPTSLIVANCSGCFGNALSLYAAHEALHNSIRHGLRSEGVMQPQLDDARITGTGDAAEQVRRPGCGRIIEV